MMARTILVILVAILGSGQLRAESEKTAPPDNVKLQSILNAWKAQEEQFRAVHVVWSQSLPSVWACAGAGRVDCQADIDEQVIRYVPAPVPVFSPMNFAYRTGTSTDAAFAEALASRFRIKHPPVAPPILLERYASAGECFDRFLGTERSPNRVLRNSSLAVLDGDLISPAAHWLHPVLLALRPAQFRLQFIGASRTQLPAEAARVEGRACVRLVEHNEASDCEVELWLEPTRNFAVRRAFFRSRGELNEQVDLNYRDDDRERHAPDSWLVLGRSKRGPNAQLFPGVELLFESTVGHVSKLTANEPGKDRPSPPALQPGTVLVDRISGGTYRIGDDGSRQRISASEFTESQSAVGSRELATLGAIGVLVSILIARNRASLWRLLHGSKP